MKIVEKDCNLRNLLQLSVHTYLCIQVRSFVIPTSIHFQIALERLCSWNQLIFLYSLNFVHTEFSLFKLGLFHSLNSSQLHQCWLLKTVTFLKYAPIDCDHSSIYYFLSKLTFILQCCFSALVPTYQFKVLQTILVSPTKQEVMENYLLNLYPNWKVLDMNMEVLMHLFRYIKDKWLSFIIYLSWKRILITYLLWLW